MKITILLEHRFSQTPDRKVWTQAAFAYPFWQRYLDVFEDVRVVARVQAIAKADTELLAVNGKGVEFWPLPHYVGPVQYCQQARQVRRAINNALDAQHAVIMRVPSALATTAVSKLQKRQQPYGVEVVGDPYDVFAPGAVQHPLRPFFRWWFVRQLRQHCANAVGTAYVTAAALQRRYPVGINRFSTHYSSVELPETAFVAQPRIYRARIQPINLILVGSLAQLYKAPDVLLQAFYQCINKGLNLRLTIVGDGKHRRELEAIAHTLEIEQRVHFLGQLPAGAAVRAQLDTADLFVLPSRQEGLPRAMIEAMARGLPCIGSTVGGIPELLPPEDTVPPGDAAALAQKIYEVATNPERMTHMSQRNLEKAWQYEESQLRTRRIAFYHHIKEVTEQWIAGNSDTQRRSAPHA